MNQKIALLFLLEVVFWSCNSSELGDNFFLLEGDTIKDRVIVYCTSQGAECYSGIPLIPTYDRQFKIGQYAEYVDHFTSDRNWIIARTVAEDDQKYYWILNKKIGLGLSNDHPEDLKRLIEENLYGPYGFYEFIEKKKELAISLDLE